MERVPFARSMSGQVVDFIFEIPLIGPPYSTLVRRCGVMDGLSGSPRGVYAERLKRRHGSEPRSCRPNSSP